MTGTVLCFVFKTMGQARERVENPRQSGHILFAGEAVKLALYYEPFIFENNETRADFTHSFADIRPTGESKLLLKNMRSFNTYLKP